MKTALITSRKYFNQWNEEHIGVSINLKKLLNDLSFSCRLEIDFDLNRVKPEYFSDIDLIVLSGGETMGKFPERDLFEVELIRYAYENSLPILGICRGMQIISKYFGVDPELIPNHAGTKHQLIGNTSETVGSYHHFGIKRLPNDFISHHMAPDKSIESFLHLFKPIAGVMWHPEREFQSDYFNNLVGTLMQK